jgi:Tol biopolymer transport system component
MKFERWQEVEALFHEALGRAPESRIAFLSEACHGDLALQQEVAALVASFDAANTFLETPAADSFGFTGHPGPAPSLTPSLTPSLINGQQLAHYEIRSQLGSGGMGEVYLAHDTKLDRQIALKLLPVHFAADPERVRRFEREARAASALNHPNIIIIHEIGQEDGKHFIATEYIEGETLRQRLGRGELAQHEAVAIARQVAGALAAAHQAGLIHRDIKPENIMSWPDGLVKVLDFGLAKPLYEEPLHDWPSADGAPSNATLETDPDLLIGSLNYLSPEQVRREKLDPRTDLFSLGVVLYEMLAGARPFTGATAAEVCGAILHNDPQPLTPSPLSHIVNRALAKERNSRYQSAVDLRVELEQFERSLQSEPPSRWRRSAAIAAALAVLVLLGLWLWRTRPVVVQPARLSFAGFSGAPAQKLTDLPGQELFPSLSPDGQSVVFVSRQEGNWDIYRQAAGARTAVNLTKSATSFDLQPAYSPDGQQIAFRSSRNGGGVFVMNSDGSHVTQLTDAGFNPAWSPDGRELAVADDNCWDYEARNTYPSASRLWAVNVATHARRVITEGDAVQASWSPHGQRIAFWGEQKGGHRDIWTVAASGGERTPVTDDAFIDWNPVWSPEGGELYFLSNRGGEMNLWRVAIDENTGHLRGAPEPATLPSNNCQYVNFARNGSALVYGQTTGSENLWQIAFDPARGQVSGAATPLTQGLKRYTMFSMAPDEKSFAYLARGEPQQDLFTADLLGTPLRRLTDDAAQDIVPRWSPDGQWIAFLSDRSGKYEIWKVRPDGTGLAQMTHEPGKEVIAPVWTPDSRRLLYQIRNVNSYIIDAERPGVEQLSLALPGQPPPGFIPWDWSPDGAYLVGWQPTLVRGIVVYSVANQRYERLTDLGLFPIWLNDSRRVLFRDSGDLYLLDRQGGKPQKIYSLKQPNQIGAHALSRDNRRLYFTDVSAEADIWLLKLE